MAQEVFTLVGKTTVEGVDKVNKQVKSMVSNVSTGGNSMVDTFKRIGTAVVTYLAVDKIIGFGQQIVQSAATVKAQTAQFEAAFKDLQDEATKAFESIGEETGILATRLQVVGTGAFSQFKGAGLEASEALKKSETYMRMAADAAAYYDMSLEETDTLLRSFIRGNTEAGDRLGLFTSESQRNEAALDKLGKKYIECTEAEKQMIMLDIAQSIYDASGATGQAAREADGYENVMGNLKETWRQFTAIIGTPVLEAVVPIVQNLTTAFAGVNETLKSSDNLFEGFATVISNLSAKIREALPQVVAVGGQLITDLYNAIMNGIPKVTSLGVEIFGKLGNTLKENLPSLIQNGLTMINGLVAKIRENLPHLVTAGMDMIGNLVQGLLDSLPTLIEQVPQIVSNIAGLINDNMPIILQKGFDIVVNIGRGIINAIPTLIANIPQIFTAIVDVWNAINWLSLGKGMLDGIWNGIKGIFGSFKSWVTNSFNSVGMSIQNIFNGILSFAGKIWNAILNVIKSPIEGAKTVVSAAVNGIKTTVSNVFNGVKNTVTSIWNGIKSAITSPIETAKNFVSDAINKIKSFFNFEFKWPHIPLPHFTISGSINPLDWFSKGLPKIGIEWYAKGGILEEPMAFGVNPYSGKVMAGGEAGPEAIAPISELQKYVGESVKQETNGLNDTLNAILRLLSDLLPNMNMQMVLDTGVLVGQISPQVDDELGRIKERNKRR